MVPPSHVGYGWRVIGTQVLCVTVGRLMVPPSHVGYGRWVHVDANTCVVIGGGFMMLKSSVG